MVTNEQRRIHVDGFCDSDVHVAVTVVQLKTGAVHMAVQGVEPTLQNLVDIRQLLDGMVKELDAKFPQMVNDNVKEMQRG
jgi:hypothetical protein